MQTAGLESRCGGVATDMGGVTSQLRWGLTTIETAKPLTAALRGDHLDLRVSKV